MDITALSQPISEDQPCGEDLEYDSDFQKLELAVEIKPEQQMGDEVIPGEEPDWKTAKKIALDLGKKSHDIRIAVMLTQSMLALDGLQGFADGLQYINNLLENYWDTVYPQTDEGDDYPVSRMNTLMELASRDKTLALLRKYPLISIKGIGRFDLLDVEIAEGKRKPSADQAEPASESVINAAFKALSDSANVDPQAYVTENIQHLESVNEQLLKLRQTLNDRATAVNAPDLTALDGTISQLKGIYQRYYQPMESSHHDTSPATSEVTSNESLSAVIGSRDDAMKAIDRVCEYFRRYEPSSPVPLVLERAKRMVNMDFIQILQDVVPDSVSQAETIIHGSNKDG